MEPVAGTQNTPPAGTQAGEPPVTPPASPPASTPPAAPSDSTEPTNVEGYKNLIDKLRKESEQAARDAKASRAEAERVAKLLADKEDAEKSDAERLAARAEKAEKDAAAATAHARELSMRFAITNAARDLNFENPDDPYNFLKLGDVTFDEAGQPQGIKELVEQLAKDRPYLIKKTETAPAKVPPSATPRSQRDGGGKTAEELAARQSKFAGHTHSSF